MAREFSGNYAYNIDPKGRVTIPSVYRADLGQRFTLGLNGQMNALALYPQEEWEATSRKLDRIPASDARGMAYVRLIKAFSFTNQNLDAQGRVLLPAVLRKQAGLDRAVRFAGMGRYMEIWDEDRFQAINDASMQDIGALLEYINNRYFAPAE